jgi:hypothetical protein
MKTKKEASKRHRSSNLELLGGVSGEALRAIRETAGRACLPLERVFADVVAIGVSVVTDPHESPYTSLIAFRTELALRQQHGFSQTEHSSVETATGEHPGPGGPGPDAGERTLGQEPDAVAGTGFDQGQSDLAGPGVIVEQRGLWSQDQEGAQVPLVSTLTSGE